MYGYEYVILDICRFSLIYANNYTLLRLNWSIINDVIK